MRNLLALTFAAMLALAACAADDGTDEATDAAAASDDAGSDDGASEDGADGEGASDDGASDDSASGDSASGDSASGDDGEAEADDSAPADDTAGSGDGGSGDNEAFCTAMAELDEALDLEPPLLDPSRSPEEVEELVVDVETKFQAVVDNSPPEYEADWVIVTDAFREMTGLIRDAEFEVDAVDQAAVLEAGSNEEAFAAGDRLPSEQEFCGS